MTELTRRRIVAAAGATAAAGALAPLAPPAQAAAPLAGRQAPSFYRCKVGEFEVTVVNDGARAIPLPAQFVRNVANEEVLAPLSLHRPRRARRRRQPTAFCLAP